MRPMRHLLCLFTGLLLSSALHTPALAWGPAGHATVGSIAAQLMAGTRAEREVRQRLSGMTLAEVGVWADCVKAVRAEGEGFVYADAGRYPECQRFETPQERAAAIAYVRNNWHHCGAGPDDEPCHKRYHYTDVAVQQPAYAPGLAGTRDHDVVAATAAAVAVLQGRPAPAPFHLQPREALRLLVHLVGDLHQPLHVGSVYLDAEGQPIDPDHQPHDHHHDTVGGNRLDDDGVNLHRRWDDVPAACGPHTLGTEGLADARRVPRTPGLAADWPRAWATDTLQAARQAYGGLRFGPVQGPPRHWPVLMGANQAAGVVAERERLQRAQLVKAGARLAQLLQALWP